MFLSRIFPVQACLSRALLQSGEAVNEFCFSHRFEHGDRYSVQLANGSVVPE